MNDLTHNDLLDNEKPKKVKKPKPKSPSYQTIKSKIDLPKLDRLIKAKNYRDDSGNSLIPIFVPIGMIIFVTMLVIIISINAFIDDTKNTPTAKKETRQQLIADTVVSPSTENKPVYGQGVGDIAYDVSVPEKKNEIYELGMRMFSKASLAFAGRIKSPFKKIIAIFSIAKNFPPKYWPEKVSNKVAFFGNL